MVLLAAVTGALAVPERVAATPPPAPSCDLVSPGFSVTYDPTTNAGKSSIGTMSVDCTSSGPLAIQIDLSRGRSGNYVDRTMLQTGGGAFLHYNVLFGMTTDPFGDGTAGTQHVQTSASPTNGEIYIAQSLRLVIPPHQFAAPGQYTDSLVVTVQF
jgi:spore coat protein U-like protein